MLCCCWVRTSKLVRNTASALSNPCLCLHILLNGLCSAPFRPFKGPLLVLKLSMFPKHQLSDLVNCSWWNAGLPHLYPPYSTLLCRSGGELHSLRQVKQPAKRREPLLDFRVLWVDHFRGCKFRSKITRRQLVRVKKGVYIFRRYGGEGLSKTGHALHVAATTNNNRPVRLFFKAETPHSRDQNSEFGGDVRFQQLVKVKLFVEFHQNQLLSKKRPLPLL
mmetsp:Transcript_3142/g.6505  ORF Transcript_3142/g.6505 Transcript_3142/m.6505 type:complete len:220 (-) Transcript_3142:1457-2116(-)